MPNKNTPRQENNYDAGKIQVIPRPQNWPQWFAEIKRRPKLWLSKPSIFALADFVFAWVLAEEHHQVATENKMKGWDEFEQWIQTKFGERSIDSFRRAAHMEASEEKAFHLWLEWYETFLKETHE